MKKTNYKKSLYNKNLLNQLYCIAIELTNTDRVLEFIIRIPRKYTPHNNYFSGRTIEYIKKYLVYTLQFNKKQYSQFEITEIIPILDEPFDLNN